MADVIPPGRERRIILQEISLTRSRLVSRQAQEGKPIVRPLINEI